MRPARADPIGRLTKRPDFLAAAKSRRFHTERMTVQGRHRDGEAGGLRIGLTVTKRVGRATERNRIKRRLRAAVRAVGPGHAAAPFDMVVIARREILGAPFETLTGDLARAFLVLTTPKLPRGGPDPHIPADGGRLGTSHA